MAIHGWHKHLYILLEKSPFSFPFYHYNFYQCLWLLHLSLEAVVLPHTVSQSSYHHMKNNFTEKPGQSLCWLLSLSSDSTSFRITRVNTILDQLLSSSCLWGLLSRDSKYLNVNCAAQPNESHCDTRQCWLLSLNLCYSHFLPWMEKSSLIVMTLICYPIRHLIHFFP